MLVNGYLLFAGNGIGTGTLIVDVLQVEILEPLQVEILEDLVEVEIDLV